VKTGSQPLVLLLVGLPGAGKTTLARRLAPAIGAVTLSRDDIRDAIFPEALLDYSSEQNQVGTDALLGVLGYLLARPKPAFIIVDGKPFSRKAEIATVKQLVEASGARLLILHCVAPQGVIEGRLQRGLADERNVRAQRDPEKAARIRTEFEPIDAPHLVVDTTLDGEEVLSLCLAAIRQAEVDA
jgi:predicted kinase